MCHTGKHCYKCIFIHLFSADMDDSNIIYFLLEKQELFPRQCIERGIVVIFHCGSAQFQVPQIRRTVGHSTRCEEGHGTQSDVVLKGSFFLSFFFSPLPL